MPANLKNLKITAVALCKRGANPDAHIMLYKSMDDGGGKVMKTLEEILKSLTAEDQATVTAEIEKAKKPPIPMEDLMDGGKDDATENPDGTPKIKAKGNPAAKQLVKSLNDTIATLTQNVAKTDAEKDADMLKSMPESIQKTFKAMQDQVAASTAIAKKMEDESITKAFVAKAQLFKSIPTTAEELGAVLKSVSKADAALGTKLEGILKATNEMLEKSVVFKSMGKNHNDTTVGTALEALNKIAGEMVVKGKITKEQAFAKALADNPTLYTTYRDELLNSEE